MWQRLHWQHDSERLTVVFATRLFTARRSDALRRQGDVLLEFGAYFTISTPDRRSTTVPHYHQNHQLYSSRSYRNTYLNGRKLCTSLGREITINISLLKLLSWMKDNEWEIEKILESPWLAFWTFGFETAVTIFAPFLVLSWMKDVSSSDFRTKTVISL